MSATTYFDDPAQAIFIPARELTGTREAKLEALDAFLAQLHVVRLALSGHPIQLDVFGLDEGHPGGGPAR